jgi:hypothetical protein
LDRTGTAGVRPGLTDTIAVAECDLPIDLARGSRMRHRPIHFKWTSLSVPGGSNHPIPRVRSRTMGADESFDPAHHHTCFFLLPQNKLSPPATLACISERRCAPPQSPPPSRPPSVPPHLYLRQQVRSAAPPSPADTVFRPASISDAASVSGCYRASPRLDLRTPPCFDPLPSLIATCSGPHPSPAN